MRIYPWEYLGKSYRMRMEAQYYGRSGRKRTQPCDKWVHSMILLDIIWIFCNVLQWLHELTLKRHRWFMDNLGFRSCYTTMSCTHEFPCFIYSWWSVARILSQSDLVFFPPNFGNRHFGVTDTGDQCAAVWVQYIHTRDRNAGVMQVFTQTEPTWLHVSITPLLNFNPDKV